MNVLVYAPYASYCPHYETDLELVERHLSAGDHVRMLTCRGELAACDPNPTHDYETCVSCMARADAGVRLLSRPITVDTFPALTDQDRQELDELRGDFADIEDLKSYRVGQLDLGYAALSCLLSLVRDPEPDLRKHRELLRGFLRASWVGYRLMGRYLATHDIDLVYLFNGRLAALRGALRACQEAGIEFATHERASNHQRYSLFHNTMPHDAAYRQREMLAAWEAAGLASTRDGVASQWYFERAAGVSRGWISHVTDQVDDLLPDNWNPDEENIVAFVSSDDELAAIGDEWRNSVYASQAEGIRAIDRDLLTSQTKLRMYVRLHPNLRGVDNRQARELRELGSPGVTVIPPESPVSSYALMRHAHKVLSFGSTTGIEAVFWNTPSILCGPSFYDRLGGTYNPSWHGEVVGLLRGRLAPKSREAALIYGYYNATYGIPFQHFEATGLYSGYFKQQRLRPGLLVGAKLRLLKNTRGLRRLARSVVGPRPLAESL